MTNHRSPKPRARARIPLAAWVVAMAAFAGGGCGASSPEPSGSGGAASTQESGPTASGGGGAQPAPDPLEGGWQSALTSGCNSGYPTIDYVTLDIEGDGAGTASVHLTCNASDAYFDQSPILHWVRQEDGTYEIDLFCSNCPCPDPIHMSCELSPQRELHCDVSLACSMLFR